VKQAFPALRAGIASSRTGFALKRRPLPGNPACSCFRQSLLAAYPGDRLLSIGCRTDRSHDWQTWQNNNRL